MTFEVDKEQHGIWRIIPSPELTEIIALSGFDFQVLDCEHGVYDFHTLGNDIRACELHHCKPIVRVGGLDQVQVQRCLDLGAAGIVFPQLVDYDDVVKATRMINYAPDGTRGFNPFVRAWGYGDTKKTVEQAACIIIIESLKAVEQLDDILALPGIDLIYIGVYDLSAQLGCLGQVNDPQLLEVVEIIIQKCKSAGIAVGLMISNKIQYQTYRSLGVNVFFHTIDSDQLTKAFGALIPNLK